MNEILCAIINSILKLEPVSMAKNGVVIFLLKANGIDAVAEFK